MSRSDRVQLGKRKEASTLLEPNPVPKLMNVYTVRMIGTRKKGISFLLSSNGYCRVGCFLTGDALCRKCVHRMPESASALWRIVSLTAAKTSRIFEVSVACVRLSNNNVSILTHNLAEQIPSQGRNRNMHASSPFVVVYIINQTRSTY